MLSFTVGLSRASVPTIVQNDTASVDALYVVLNALGYLGLFCLVGLTAFDLFVVRIPTADRRLHKVAALVAVSAYLVLVPLTAARERGAGLRALFDPGLPSLDGRGSRVDVCPRFFRSSPHGDSWTSAAPGGLLGWHCRCSDCARLGPARGPHADLRARVAHDGRRPDPRRDGCGLVGWTLALILHVTRARRRNGDPAETAAALGRFSTLAGGVVFLLGITGTVMAVVMVGSVTVLLGSSYGQLLLVKLAMVAAIGGLAAWNRFGLVPAWRARESRALLGAGWPWPSGWRRLGW
ncbi:CopD family protein [Arthrobacter alpinus]|nr:CopD family protein [Arthrobacter alpinus]